MNKNYKYLVTFLLAAICQVSLADGPAFQLSLKQPGNDARTWQLREQAGGKLTADGLESKISISYDEQKWTPTAASENMTLLKVTVHARETVYFNLGVKLSTDFKTDDCDFYLPGFWYHKNLRSPREAPSFHTSKSWNVREDRLSSPLTGVFDTATGRSVSGLVGAANYPEYFVGPGALDVMTSGMTFSFR